MGWRLTASPKGMRHPRNTSRSSPLHEPPAACFAGGIGAGHRASELSGVAPVRIVRPFAGAVLYSDREPASSPVRGRRRCPMGKRVEGETEG